MNKQLNVFLAFVFVFLLSKSSFAQLTGTKNIPGDYATVAAAVNALNTAGVGTGGVTFNVAANYAETISSTISLTATGTSANPITFQKDAATVGANPSIIAYSNGTGTPATATQDGIWRFIGSDYVTIDGFALSDTNTLNPATMEYGFGFYKANATNGCQNNTIKNCSVSLSRNNNAIGTAPAADGSAGILLTNATSTAAVTGITVTSTAGANSNNRFYKNTITNTNTGIALIGFAASSPFTLADTGNDIGGASIATANTITNFGGGGILAIAAGIKTVAQYGLNVSYNTVNNNDGGGVNHAFALKGIWLSTALSANSTVTYNTVSVKGGGTTHAVSAIENTSGSTAASNTVNINNNLITNCSYSTATTGPFYGILTSATPATLNINNNTFHSNSYSGTTGLMYFINNTGAATVAININNNNIGAPGLNAISFTAINTGAQVFISNTGGGAASALSINNNVIQGINYAATATGACTLILNSAGTLSQTINSNTFTNLAVNTAGSLTFISSSSALPAAGTQTVNSNNISGTFSKTAGGTVTLFSSIATCNATSTTTHENNNFSNITVTGATTITGWVLTDGGTSTKYVRNNTFTNWTGGTAAITAMVMSVAGTVNGTYNNTINNITNASSITGISASGGANFIYSNTINTLTNTAAAGVIGISSSAGTLQNIYKNKIYDLQASIAGGNAYGISVSGTTSGATAVNVYNNFIGDLRTPAASATEPIRGISITSTKVSSSVNVYYNTIYLNATSTGTNFGTSGIYHTASATSTTCRLTLINNSVTNISTPNGTGLTVGYRRSSTATANYNTSSNNNLYYAGAASASRLIYYDGTNKDQTITSYKTRITPAEAQSVTEDITAKFLSTTGSSSSYLHIDPSKRTQLESGGLNITGYTEDADAAVRAGNSGYVGAATLPDIGADEFEGIKFQALSGTYNVGVGQVYTSLTKADGLFSAMNSVGLVGDVTINVTSDLSEDGSNSLFQWTEQGAGNYDLTIQPSSATLRTISGNVLTGLIKLNGTDRVTIDGSFSGSGEYLAFSNTNTAGSTGTAFSFINGATNNTLRYCKIEAYANATNGVLLFGTSTVGGNSSNLVEHCSINGTVAGNSSNVCIYSGGTVANENTNTLSANSIYNYRDRGLDISATGSTAWTITNNSFFNGDISGAINFAAASVIHHVRILGGAGYTISSNYVGGNAALATGTSAAYASTLGNVSVYGILLTTTSATPTSNIKGNAVAKISISSVVPANSSIEFIGIETNGSGINIGGSLAGEGNIVGSNTVNGSIALTTSTTTATFRSVMRGISCNSAGGAVLNNKVSGIDIQNIGTAPAYVTFLGIYVNNVSAPSQVNNNIIGSSGVGAVSNSIRVLSSSTATATPLTGILIGASVTNAVQVNNNLVQNISHQSATASGSIVGISNTAAGTSVITIANNNILNNSLSATAGSLYGISNGGASASVVISANTISANTTTGTSPLLYGIYNSAAAPSLTITTNLFTSNITTSTAGVFYAINNAGAVTTTLNINSNYIGNASYGPIIFNAANSGAQIFINNSAGAGTCALSISNNNFQGIDYAVSGTGANTFISNSAATLSQVINGNTFINLNLQTAGNVTLITNSVIVSATGTQSVNSNSIAGTFTKKAGGTLTLITSSAASLAGSVITISSNNFSNLTVPGATIINGIVNTDAGNSNKIIDNNTFTNWVGGTGAITVITVNITGTTNSTVGNIINNITSGGAITGITSGAGNNFISSNTINTLSTTAAAVVTGISNTTGTVKNIYKNKIYDLQAATATGTVNGILISGGTTVNVYNNIIGDLRTPAASAVDPIRAISVTSTVVSTNVNVYYNTIYLNATSSGTNFGTSGIYHVTSATVASTTASLSLINNSITNLSTPKGTGLVVAYRRSLGTGTALSNYNTASNNNLWYAGVPSASRLIFYDGTNSDQTLAAFKTRMSTRDAASITEDLSTKFLSTTSSSGVYLHMNEAVPSLVESGGISISTYADDFDGQIRQGNPGYAGSGYAPDIGADEIFGIEDIAPAISYTSFTNTTTTTNRTLSSVIITDASGVNTTAGTKPRIYYKRLNDANTYVDNTSSTNGWKFNESTGSSSPFSFVIDYSKMYGGSSVTAGIIQYFIVAQDLATSANIAVNSATFNAVPLSVSLTSTAFPVTGTINSYNIPFAGNYNVGVGNVFTSLTKADGLFSTVNAVGLNGDVTVTLTSDLAEDGATALSQWTEQGVGNYTLKIQPDGTTVRTASGNAASGLIRLNGADRVTIDGSYLGSGNYLSFSNTNTAGTTGSALTFINGATNNIIRYCNFEAYANATNGVILFGTTSGAGNSSNLIDYNTINGTVGVNHSNTAIYSAGTIGNENTSNIISHNSIYNFLDKGLDISSTGSSAWTINNNSFFSGDVSATIDYAASSSIHAIRVLGGTGYTISNNYIGGNDAGATGTDATYNSTLGNVSFYGIALTTSGASPASNIKGNTISKVIVTPSPAAANSIVFTGIETSGSGINIGGSSSGEGNLIGSNTTNGAISITTTTTSALNTSILRGINCNSVGGIVTGNQVGGIDIRNIGSGPAGTRFSGIYINNASAPTQVNNNVIGSNGSLGIANNIRVRTTSLASNTSLTGISLSSVVASAVEVNGNTIQNIAARSTTASGSFMGIDNSATSSSAIITIANDTIKNITTLANTASAVCVFTGIASSSPSVITGNNIDNMVLDVSGANAQVIGINVSGAFAQQVSSNTISNLSTASQKASVIETNSPALSATIGILNSSTSAGQEVSNNRITNLSSNTTAAVNTVVTGIAITATNSGNIFKNRLNGFSNTATGSQPGIAGITANGGSFNVYNNAISLNNLVHVNGVSLYGIIHNTGGTNWNYFHNTISLSGIASGTSTRTAAFIRPTEGVLYLRNNILINTRSGTGSHYAISNPVSSPSLTWTASTSNYNNIYSADTTRLAEWGAGVRQNFIQWKASSGSGANSVSRPVSFVSSITDLDVESVSNCALNNAGTPITSPVVVNTDINGIARNGTTPDIGAYEFSYTPFIIQAANASPVCNGSLLQLNGDAGDALNPTYSWTNPLSVVVATTQNPEVAAANGLYTLRVTDENGCYVTAQTNVSITARPAVSAIAGTTTICEGSSVTLTLTVTGSGPISGTLSSGDLFTGTAPTISLTFSPSDTTNYYITDMNDANCASINVDIDDTLKVAVLHDALWTGATSTNWNIASNWYCNAIPVTDVTAVIPGSLSRYPVITSGTNAVNDLVVRSGGSLSISNAVLQVSGTIANSGTLTATNGSIEMNGIAPQRIAASTFTTNTIKDLTVNNPLGVTLAGTLNLTNALTITNGTLTTGGFLVLKSSGTATARVAEITSSAPVPVIGTVRVERYVPGRRKYRIITSSVTSAVGSTLAIGQEVLSIWGNWQNAGNTTTPNVGTLITGGATADGFDPNSTTASLFTYNETTRGYMAFSTANGKSTKYTPLKAGVPYYMFIYGDRTNTATTPTPNNTIISSTGTLLTGTQTYNTGSAMPLTNTPGRFTLLGNPYAAPINWATVTRTNLSNTYWGFDPNLSGSGGYVTVSTTGSVTIVSPMSGTTGLNQYIQPGQGFFVKTTASSPVLTIRESDKATNNNANAFRTTGSTVSLMAINLMYETGTTKTLADGVVAAFDSSFSNAVSSEDAIKLTNASEVIGLLNGTDLLSIEGREMPKLSDTLMLNVTKLTRPQYLLQIFATDMKASSAIPYLEDTYLNTKRMLLLTDTNYVSFNIISSDSASSKKDRFRIVFRQATTLPVTFTNITATPKNKNVQVDWNVAVEDGIKKYELERSINGTNFVKVTEVSAKGVAGIASYDWLDVNAVAGNNYYRIRAVQLDANVIYSKVVLAKIETTGSSISVYPNPVKQQQVHLQLSNLDKGVYSLQVYNAEGKLVHTSKVNHVGGSANQTVQLQGSLPAGAYYVRLSNNDINFKQTIIIE